MEENTGANTSTNSTETTTKQPRSQARSILRQFHEISSRRYAGDYGACDVLLDFDRAVSIARLTRRQRDVLTLVYGEGLTQAEAAGRLGVRQDTVSRVIANGEERLDEVYDRWRTLDEEMAE